MLPEVCKTTLIRKSHNFAQFFSRVVCVGNSLQLHFRLVLSILWHEVSSSQEMLRVLKSRSHSGVGGCAFVNTATDSCLLRLYKQDPAGRWLQEPSEGAERNAGSQPLCLAVEHDVLPGSSQGLLTLLSSCLCALVFRAV